MTIQIIIVMPWCCDSRRARTPTLFSVGRNGRRSEQQAPPHKRHHPAVMPIKPSTPNPAPSHITFTERVYMLPRQAGECKQFPQQRFTTDFRFKKVRQGPGPAAPAPSAWGRRRTCSRCAGAVGVRGWRVALGMRVWGLGFGV